MIPDPNPSYSWVSVRDHEKPVLTMPEATNVRRFRNSYTTTAAASGQKRQVIRLRALTALGYAAGLMFSA